METVGERIKRLRDKKGLTQSELAKSIKSTKQTLYKYESGIITNIPYDKIQKLASALDVTPAQLLGWDQVPDITYTDVREFEIIGSIAAGYDHAAIESHTGETVLIPVSYLHGRPPTDYFVLRVNGESMYPEFRDGDNVLVRRCDSVDSGTVAVILYNSDEATLKRVKYVQGEDWLELIPTNPEYAPKRIEGCDLECCMVLGRVEQLIRKY